MTIHETPELTVKEKYRDCKTFECPRFLALCETNEDGKPVFSEGGLAYNALIHCNNWTIGLSDGECPIDPSVLEA